MFVRTLAAAAVVAGIALGTGHGAAQSPKPNSDNQLGFYPPARSLIIGNRTAQPKQAEPGAEKVVKLSDLLAKRISLDKPYEGKFKDAMAMLAEKYDLPIILDPALRDFQGPGAACDGLEDKTVKLPRLMNVRADTVLRLTCEQADAMYLVYPDYLRIVPAVFGLYETGVTSAGLHPNDDEPGFLTAEQILKTRPLIKRAIVTLSFKGATVADVLDEIAATSGANVALAPLVGEKANAKLTVRFANTPVDAAVRTVCELADLGVIEDANVLVVTTRERAAARAKDEAEKRAARMLGQNLGLIGLNAQVFQPNLLGGLGGFGGLAQSPDQSAEIAKLKEQNEQMKKQIEELMKSVKK